MVEDPARVVTMDGCAVRVVDADKVTATRERVLEPEEAERLADVFRLVGDATRMRILYALLEAGELCVCDLAASIDVPENNVSHALRLLRAAGVVRNRRSGRMSYYSLDDAHVRVLLDLSREHLHHRERA